MVDENEGYARSFTALVRDPALSPEQAAHVEFIAKEFAEIMSSKYIVGQRKHGGDLFRMSKSNLLSEAILEAVDQVVYLLTLREKLRNESHTGEAVMRAFQKQQMEAIHAANEEFLKKDTSEP